jgi:putative oxidoreductase
MSDNLVRAVQIVGRAMFSLLFIVAGASKLFTWKAVEAYMASKGVPALLLPLVVLLEIVGGLSLLSGFYLRWAAPALAGFCVLAAVIFHNDFADRREMTLFLKDIALAGALLVVASGAWRGLEGRDGRIGEPLGEQANRRT